MPMPGGLATSPGSTQSARSGSIRTEAVLSITSATVLKPTHSPLKRDSA